MRTSEFPAHEAAVAVTQQPRLAFLGTGYLGATYAICFAELGYEVVGFDIDEAKIAKLAGGDVPFHEPGLDELLRRNLASGRLRFTTSYQETAEFADVHFICVGTPQRADGMGADLAYVEASVTGLAQHLTRKALIVGKSTVPVGTAEWIEQLVAKHAPAGLGVEVAWSPEFLQEGFAVEDVMRPNRIVVGVKTQWANDMLHAAHKGVFDLATTEDREVPLVVTDFATAELVKVAANAFLATKISFINAMAEVCEVAGGDVTQLAKAIGYDPRIGNRFLQACVGFGAGCLPKDIRAFQARAQELGAGEAPSVATGRHVRALGRRGRQGRRPRVRAHRVDRVPQPRPRVPEQPGHRALVIDGRNCLDPARWADVGWEYRGMGRPNANAAALTVTGEGLNIRMPFMRAGRRFAAVNDETLYSQWAARSQFEVQAFDNF